MARHTRYQALIVRDDSVLLIRHQMHRTGRSYWVIPGGGIEVGESETECVVREAREETNLEVKIERLLFDEPGHPDGMYKRRKTYLCRPVAGQASPGYEPEEEAAEVYAIVETRWFDLRDESGWEKSLMTDPFTYPQLAHARHVLGYSSKGAAR
jgi:ADP-ribose pyrophosphatase YjhB (NUDIX family)